MDYCKRSAYRGLHDLIDSATSVDVNERIPDEIFDYADEVVLVDIEPEALIQRMREGKIYNKTHAAMALENFSGQIIFRPCANFLCGAMRTELRSRVIMEN